jgi:hypothetical protein
MLPYTINELESSVYRAAGPAYYHSQQTLDVSVDIPAAFRHPQADTPTFSAFPLPIQLLNQKL